MSRAAGRAAVRVVLVASILLSVASLAETGQPAADAWADVRALLSTDERERGNLAAKRGQGKMVKLRHDQGLLSLGVSPSMPA